MGTVRIFDQNYVASSILANSDVSSAQSAFPITNAYNANRRSKVWRSNGFWQITSGSNTIVFRETAAGPDLTATITAGSYTSTTTFLAAIKTALQAVGTSTYTITQNANLKINIASNGSGGDGTLTLKWTHANSLAMAAILGFDTSVDQSGALTYSADLLRIHYPNEWVLWDLGIASNPTSFALIGPRNSPIKISPSATVTLQGNETNVWDTPSYSTVITHDDEVMSLINDSGLHTNALRYWRLSITDIDNPLGYVEVGAFFLGKHYQPTRGAVQFPLKLNPLDRTETVISEGGQTFSEIRQKTEGSTLQWFGLTKQELEYILAFFNNNVGTGIPFFISMDTDAVFSSAKERRLKFVKFKGDPDYELISPNVFNFTMKLEEQL